MTGRRTVRGRVAFRGPVPALPATLRVRVEDVSRADAAAPVVASACLVLDHAPAPGESVPFELEVPDGPPGRRLGVRVHVDGSGDGTVAPADLVSTRSHVLSTGAPDDLEVEVRPAS